MTASTAQNQNNVQTLEKIQSNRISGDMITLRAEPLTDNLALAISAFDSRKCIILEGCPGTGKTFVVLNKAIQELLSGSKEFRRIDIFRSAVAIRNIGFLPGEEDKKVEVFEDPYIQIVNETFGTKNIEMYKKLKDKKLLNFHSTSYNQGITLNQSLVIVDECQNLNYTELYNVFTRLGEGSLIFFSGDYKKQNMLNKNKKDVSGFELFMRVVKSHEKLRSNFEFITMTPDDIVRGNLCKYFVEADYNYIDPDLK